MQTCTVEVQLGGNVKNTAIIQNVTPAEVQVLRKLHGPNSVIFRGERDEKKIQPHKEIARLQERYHTSDPTLMGAKIPVFSTVFPGASPTLPLRFSEIGFGEQEVEQRILPDKPGFHGDPGNTAAEQEEDPEEESSEEEEIEAPKRGRGRPKKSETAE